MADLTLREAVLWNRSLLLTTLLVAFALRIGLAVAVERQVAGPPARLCLIPGDADGYWELARKILAGQDYSIYTPPRFALRMPGFPLLLAVSQWLFGDRPFGARCLLALVGTAACGLTYWLGRELADSTTGLLAAIYTALSPTLALFSVMLLSETAFALTLLASLIAIARLNPARERASRPGGFHSAAMTAGVLIGIATYMRPTWLYVGPLIAVAVIWITAAKPRGRAVLKPVVWLMAGLALPLSPWIVRNFAVTGHFVPTTLWVGPSLYDGLHPGATGDSDMAFFDRDQLLTRGRTQAGRSGSRRRSNCDTGASSPMRLSFGKPSCNWSSHWPCCRSSCLDCAAHGFRGEIWQNS
jgi:hypothetical protein